MAGDKKDEIVWLDSPNHRFSVKAAREQLRRHRQMVEWHDIVWFKNVVPRHSFLLWMAVQQKLTTQDKLHRFGIHGPNRCSLMCREWFLATWEREKRESVVLSELHLLRPPLDCSHFWLCCSFQPSLNIDRMDLLSNQRGKRYWSRNISTILHFQFWNYGEVVKLQHSEWIFFMISLMAVIDMKAFSICED